MTRFSVFNIVLAVIVAFQISLSSADDAVPVLLWGSSSDFESTTNAVNPFLKTSREEFDGFLRRKLRNLPPVLLCIKNNLCVEDLMKHKQDLQTVIGSNNVHYLPAVDGAVNVVKNLSSYNQTYDDYVDSISEKQLFIMPVNSLDIIPEIYKTIKESSPNLVVILTGHCCSYRRSERVKRDVSSDNSTFVVKSNRVLLYSSQPLSLKISEAKDIQLPLKPTVDESGDGTKELRLILQFNGSDSQIVKHKLTFIFEVRTAGYYTLKTVNYEPVGQTNNNQNLTTNVDIVFPFKFSYHCSHNIVFQKNSTLLSIANLQVQIDPQVSENGKVSFSDAYDCVGFTTIPIWTGIFVTAILALIIIWGLTMIIDIRTMDRFDDPKGKTITVTASQE